MKCNIGGIDRVIRILVGVIAIGLGAYYQNWWGAVGIIPLATGLIRWCPLYRLIGASTCGTTDRRSA